MNNRDLFNKYFLTINEKIKISEIENKENTFD